MDGRYVSAAAAAAAGSIGKRNNCRVVPFEGFCDVFRIVVIIAVIVILVILILVSVLPKHSSRILGSCRLWLQKS